MATIWNYNVQRLMIVDRDDNILSYGNCFSNTDALLQSAQDQANRRGEPVYIADDCGEALEHTIMPHPFCVVRVTGRRFDRASGPVVSRHTVADRAWRARSRAQGNDSTAEYVVVRALGRVGDFVEGVIIG
jgi:hypothetical protein